jgi:hypothetical protein
MINWRELQRDLPGVLRDINDTLEQAVGIVCEISEQNKGRVAVPVIRVVFTDSHGQSLGITVNFEIPGGVELARSEMIEYNSGERIHSPAFMVERRMSAKCLLCDYTGPDLDALGLCANCLLPPRGAKDGVSNT